MIDAEYLLRFINTSGLALAGAHIRQHRNAGDEGSHHQPVSPLEAELASSTE